MSSYSMDDEGSHSGPTFAAKTLKHPALRNNKCCPLNTFPLLNGSTSMPSFLNEANLQAIKKACIDDGRYYDLFTRLQALFLPFGIDFKDETLQDIAQELHKMGCILMSHTELKAESLIESWRVKNVLLRALMEAPNVGDLPTKTAIAMAVASTLVTEAQSRAEGYVVSHWSKTVCPWLYSPSESNEVHLVEFLNKTCFWVNQHLIEQGAIDPSNFDHARRHWISTGNMLFQARSGVAASKTSGTGTHTPGVTLMTSDSHKWSDVLSIIDVKYCCNDVLLKTSMEYMVEISQLVFANQVHRRFFIGALLTGSELRISILTHGSGAFSEPINIYADPIKYMQVLSWFMHTPSQYLGYDINYEAPTSTENLLLWLTKANMVEFMPTSVVSIIYSSISGFGRTTRVMAVKGPKQQPGVEQETLIVKEVWQVSHFDSDGEIHKLLEDKERLQKFRIKLEQENIPYPDVIRDTEAEKKSQLILFQQWNAKPAWDDEGIEGSYPRHLPIRDQHMSTHPVMMTDCDGAQVPDSIENIMKPMNVPMYHLVHYQTVFKTNAVRCTWFSCRREFFSGLIGALKGHFNAWLRGLIHRDPSDGNTWFWVPIADKEHAVPDWCIDEGVPKFCGDPVESDWFPMRPGMIGDFGLALDDLDDSEEALAEKNMWTTSTGTFPYRCIDRENPPNICHDLESFMVLAFVLGVNIMGPYHQLQDWPVTAPNTNPIVTGITTAIESANHTAKMMGLPNVDWGKNITPPRPPITSTHPIHTRTIAATATSKALLIRSCQVPQWAKLGIPNLKGDEVIMHKEYLTWDSFEHSLDPYWKVGNMVTVWKKIYDLLWPFPAEKRWGLTHAKLINTLQEMIDAVPVDKDGAPEKSLVMTARERYDNSLT